MRRIIFALFLCLLAFSSCEPAPDGSSSANPDFPGNMVIPVPGEGGADSTEMTYDEFWEAFPDQLPDTLYFGTLYGVSQEIKPELREYYEKKEEAIYEKYQEQLYDAQRKREYGQITAEEYYRIESEIEYKKTVEIVLLDQEILDSNVFTDYMQIQVIRNRGNEDIKFQIGMLSNGYCFESQVITVPADSRNAYTIVYNCGGRYVGGGSRRYRIIRDSEGIEQ